MKKELNLNKSVYDLVQEYPEVKDIMCELGFKWIANPIGLRIVGKSMTIPKGSELKGIAMDKIIEAFEAYGFEVIS